MEVSATLLLTGLGLAAAAGLNAYIPLLVVGLLAHFGVVHLPTPYDVLGGWIAIGILAALLAVEVVADKVPAVDSVNDVVQTLVRPASGAVLFAGAIAPNSEWSQALGLIAGLVVAGGVHATKAAVRPVANAGTAGVAAPVLSTIEDLFSLVLSLAAVLLPILALVLMVVVGWLAFRAVRRGARRLRGSPGT